MCPVWLSCRDVARAWTSGVCLSDSHINMHICIIHVVSMLCCDCVSTHLCVCGYALVRCWHVLPFVCNLKDLLLFELFIQVNYVHVNCMWLCAHIWISVNTSATFSLVLCIRCVYTGMASSAQKGSGGDLERNVRWFCWSRTSSGPPKKTAAMSVKRGANNLPWWVDKKHSLLPLPLSDRSVYYSTQK